MNGFGQYRSNLDLCLMVSHENLTELESAFVLDQLRLLFNRSDAFFNVELLRRASPVLVFCDSLTFEFEMRFSHSLRCRFQIDSMPFVFESIAFHSEYFPSSILRRMRSSPSHSYQHDQVNVVPPVGRFGTFSSRSIDADVGRMKFRSCLEQKTS